MKPSFPLKGLVAATCCILLIWEAVPAGETDGRIEAIERLLDQGHPVEAEQEARALLGEITAHEPVDPRVEARVLDALVKALWTAGTPVDDESRALAERAIRLKRETLGETDPDIATSLDNLGHLYRAAGRYEEALGYFEQGLALRQAALGPDHERVAHSLNQLGWAHYMIGDFDEARNLGERSVAIRERVAAGTAELASSMNNLAIYLKTLGDYTGAREYYERALATYEQALGPEHPNVARALTNLAILLRQQGDLTAAIATHERAIRVARETAGPDSLLVAQGLANLAAVYPHLGDDATATRLYLEALKIFESKLEPTHPRIAGTLNNLGSVMTHAGKTKAARKYLERALVARETAQGADHPLVARVLNNIAELEMTLGNLTTAASTLERSLAIMRKSLGEEHPDTADVLERLGEVRRRSGDLAAARECLSRALDIYERKLGPGHPLVAGVLRSLASLSLEMGETTAALDHALRADAIGREHLRLTAQTLPERQALAYSMVRPAGQDVALSVLAGQRGREAGLTRAVWDAVIPSRALVLDEMRVRYRARSQAAEQARQLAETSERLANLLVRGAGEQTLEQYRELLLNASQARDDAERTLAETSLSFRRANRATQLRLGDVIEAVPEGSTLVAYVRYQSQDGSSTTPRYIALVLPLDREPVAVPLGTEATVEPLVAGWRKQIAAGRKHVPGARGSGLEAYRQAGEALRRVVWDPVAALVQGGRRIFVVPDGLLHLVNLSTLPDDDGTFLLESAPPMHYLSTERDLIREEPATHGVGLLLAGGAEFGDPDRPRASPSNDGCTPFDTIRFRALPGTTREIDAVADLWKTHYPRGPESVVSRLEGAQATEDALKRMAPGHQVLHLATHGFFVDDRCGTDGAARSADVGGAVLGLAPPVSDAASGLAGLALAGANLRGGGGNGGSDGILTAQEIATLDLTGVEWVVLSACDTAVGTIRAGEGVFGLRRAFQEAGAETLITSLWPVEDASVRAWTRRLYEARLEGLPSAEAVHRASLGVLQARRRDGQSTHPFHWGAFVAVGDWR